jgi:uncharacterized protein YbdZ (MbtH family)
MLDETGADALTIDGDRFAVVVNERGEHAIWPEAQPIPAGWRATGFVGEAGACQAHVDEVWTALCRGPR